MCGIAGILAPPNPQRHDQLARMATAIAHRGPDHLGVWDDGQAVLLAHRRLAIIDLSAAGNQPMHSQCSRYHVVFNGEIYNFLELRQELEAAGHSFRGGSDTEVLLSALTRWGLQAVARCDGMFAIAVWDSQERSLHLIRDRMGEKPLCYALGDEACYFASELSALRGLPGVGAEVDRTALAEYLTFGYVPEPQSILQQVHKVPAGAIVTIRRTASGLERNTSSYWSLMAAARAGRAAPLTSEQEALEAVDQALRSAIQRQMIADVPLGAFLSGGIDSSLIVALMQAQSSRRIKTYTIGFEESGFDEREHARIVARHLGTEHVEFPITADMALQALPQVLRLSDEPLNDSSQIPTALVCALARRHVTVALSGDGADELFAGYDRHVAGIAFDARLSRLPQWARVGTHAISGPFAWMASHLPGSQGLAARISKARSLLVATDDLERYEAFAALAVRRFDRLGQSSVAGLLPSVAFRQGPYGESLGLGAEGLLYQDQARYLPGDILVKVDRAAMAVGLETRAPFLDRQLVELSWRIPLSMKVRNGQGKWLLRRLVARYLPPELARRPKQGFSIPLSAWLRGALRPWAEALLDRTRLRNEGFFDATAVRRLWDEHGDGAGRHRYQLWGILMFQAWLEGQRHAS